MKIAFIVRRFDKRGGISRYVAELAERFAAEHEVHVYANSWQDVDVSSIRFHKIPMVSFQYLKNKKKHAWNVLIEVVCFSIMSFFIVKRRNYDIIHSQGDYFGKMDVYSAHSCHRAWIDLCHQEEGSLFSKLKKSMINPLHAVLVLLEYISIIRAKVIIAVSKGVRNEFITLYGVAESKVRAVSNGVNLEKFDAVDQSALRDLRRNQLGIAKTDIVAIFVAHEFKRKGLKQILLALGILKAKEIHLLIVGRDSIEPYQTLINDLHLTSQVHYVGETILIQEYYYASDIFIFPTMYEAFSLATLEACACGLPLLITNVNGTEELVVDGVNGYFVNKDAEDIANKLARLKENRVLLRQMSQNAKKSAALFSWDITANKTYGVYADVLLRGK